MCVHLPFVDEQDELSIIHNGADVSINAGRVQRSVSLPRILLHSELVSYYYEDSTLYLEFAELPQEEEILWKDDPYFVSNSRSS
jgi:hypothetical protein